MTGMKSGAGDDPFADVRGETDDESENDQSSDGQQADDHPADDRPAEGRSTADRPSERQPMDDRSTADDGGPSGDATGRRRTDAAQDRAPRANDRMSVEDLPYIARRNVRGESVKTGRDKNVLFELRPEIAEREEEFVAELERRIGTDVPKTDAREAALAAIWERPELVVPVLEEWGLGYFED